MNTDALYLRDGDAFVGTECTRGSWYADAQSGGAVLALLGHVLEDVPVLALMSLTRLTVDIVRPVPVGVPLQVHTSVVREGKRIQVVDLVVTTAGVEHTRARALRVRDEDLSGSGAPQGEVPDDARAALLPPPEELQPLETTEGFLRHGVEMRRGDVDGLHAVWVRLLVPVVEGEPVRDTARAVLPLDCVNLIGADSRTLGRFTAINPDVSGHLLRLPEGEWVGMTGGTGFDAGVGHGVSVATLRDLRGPFGVTSTSQLVAPRAGTGSDS